MVESNTLLLEENRIYKSRDGGIYKIIFILEGFAYGEHTSPGGRTKLSWYLDGGYSLLKEETPFDLIEDVTDDYPEEVL